MVEGGISLGSPCCCCCELTMFVLVYNTSLRKRSVTSKWAIANDAWKNRHRRRRRIRHTYAARSYNMEVNWFFFCGGQKSTTGTAGTKKRDWQWWEDFLFKQNTHAHGDDWDDIIHKILSICFFIQKRRLKEKNVVTIQLKWSSLYRFQHFSFKSEYYYYYFLSALFSFVSICSFSPSDSRKQTTHTASSTWDHERDIYHIHVDWETNNNK